MASKDKILKADEIEKLAAILKARFEKSTGRHQGIDWEDVRNRLEADKKKYWSLSEMEKTGGEPDVIGRVESTGEILFADCSPESPTGRRSLCYDRKGLEERKEFKPVNSAAGMAEEMGIELLSEDEYRQLQVLGRFDTKTSSWIKTPREMRDLGGALFGDCRFGRVFIYHNGAQSYYAARGFRGILKV